MLNIKSGLEGYFAVRVWTPSLGILQYWEGKNLITNAGLDYYGAGGSAMYAVIGTDGTPAEPTDADLIAPYLNGPNLYRVIRKKQVATNPTVTYGKDQNDNTYWESTISFRAAPADLNLATTLFVKEIGTTIDPDYPHGTSGLGGYHAGIFNRSVVSNASEGIPVGPNQYLDIDYTVRSYFDPGENLFNIKDATSEQIYSGRSHELINIHSTDFLASPNILPQFSAALLNMRAMDIPYADMPAYGPSDGAVRQHTVVMALTNPTYVDGNNYLDFTGTLSPDKGNFPTGIKSVVWTGMRRHECVFDAPIQKDSDTTFTFTVRCQWQRISDSLPVGPDNIISGSMNLLSIASVSP